MNTLLLIASTLVLLLITLVILRKKLLSPTNIHSNYTTLIDYITQGIHRISKNQTRNLLLFFIPLAIIIIASKLAMNERHTTLIPLSILLGLLTSLITGKLSLFFATKTIPHSVIGCKDSLEKGFKNTLMGAAIIGITITFAAIFSLSALLLLLCWILQPEQATLLQTLSPLMTPADWTSILSDASHIQHFKNIELLVSLMAFCFGSSIYAIYCRINSGIFAKSADLTADVTGRTEFDLPEDDLRNPSVIADQVGDHISNLVGMALVLFECILFTMVSACVIQFFENQSLINQTILNLFNTLNTPLLILSCGTIASLLTLLLIKQNIIKATSLITPYIVTSILTLAIATIGYTQSLFSTLEIEAIYIGVLATIPVILNTYFTTAPNTSTIRKLAEEYTLGALPGFFKGLINGIIASIMPTVMLATLLLIPLLLFDGLHNLLSGLYGISLATTAFLSTACIVFTLGTIGPIADNTKGLASMVVDDEATITHARKLDMNGTISSQLLKCFLYTAGTLSTCMIFIFYLRRLLFWIHHYSTKALEKTHSLTHVSIESLTLSDLEEVFNLDILNPEFIIGSFLGALIACLFLALLIIGVQKGVRALTLETRRQLQEKDGIWDGTTLPEYHTIITIGLKNANKWTLYPIITALISPIIITIIFGVAGAIGALAGALTTGFCLSAIFAATGAQWKSAKKWIEATTPDHAQTNAYLASEFNDGIGDILKDAIAPSFYILIKIMAIIALLYSTLAIYTETWIH